MAIYGIDKAEVGEDWMETPQENGIDCWVEIPPASVYQRL